MKQLKIDKTVDARLQLKDVMINSLKPSYLKKFEGIKGDMADLRSDLQLKGNNLTARCGLQIRHAAALKDAEEDNVPFVASFILLFNLESKILKIKNLQGDFLS